MGIIKPLCGLLGLMVMLQKEQSVAVGRMIGNILTNELMEPTMEQEEKIKEVPHCQGGSPCGYVQVNAFGVHQHQICRCPPTSSGCSLHWDAEDGHSVTLDSQQYKFCDAAPKLQNCKRGEPAYTQATFFNPMTFEIVGESTNFHCFCAPPRRHIFYEMKEEVVDGMEVLGSVYTCSMLPPCEFEDPCKTISVARAATLVNVNCRCPVDSVCPTLSQRVTPSDMNEDFTHGKVFSVTCQPWF